MGASEVDDGVAIPETVNQIRVPAARLTGLVTLYAIPPLTRLMVPAGNVVTTRMTAPLTIDAGRATVTCPTLAVVAVVIWKRAACKGSLTVVLVMTNVGSGAGTASAWAAPSMTRAAAAAVAAARSRLRRIVSAPEFGRREERRGCIDAVSRVGDWQ
ncbi:MAG: hypothetical protein ABIZ07_04320 [Dermatophilaceae bacterium]